MSILLFDSASPGVDLPAAPPSFARAPWHNWGMAREANYDSMPQGVPMTPGCTVLCDFEPTPSEFDKWTVYDCAEQFARCAATAKIRHKDARVYMYGPAAITAAQANPVNKGVEDAGLEKLAPLFRMMGGAGVGLVLDLSLRVGQTLEGWKYATPKRIERLHSVRMAFGVPLMLMLGVRRGAGGKYENTIAHTDEEMRAMTEVTKRALAVTVSATTRVGLFAHYPSATFAADGARAYATIAQAWGGAIPAQTATGAVKGEVKP